MSVLLLIDCGNTRLKWRLQDDEQALARGALSYPDGSWTKDFVPVEWLGAECVALSGVISSDRLKYLSVFLRAEVSDYLFVAQSEEQFCGLTNSYFDVSRMGVDRWLAMVAAWGLGLGEVIVVDCGSAITVDWIDNDGNHVGGLIMPGVASMFRSLSHGTARVGGANRPRFPVIPGKNTTDCVENGVGAMLSGVGHVVRQWSRNTVPVLLTGGDAEIVAPVIGGSPILKSELVLDGLARVARERWDGAGL